jgi:hypothetical protein
MFEIFKPQHRYRPSHWLTVIPLLEKELQMIFELSSPRGNSKEQKLLVTGLLFFFLKKKDYLRKKEKEGDYFLPLRLSWEEMKLLDSLWWLSGTVLIEDGRRLLSDEELTLVKAGPGAKEFHQNLFQENPDLHQ